MSIFRLLGVVGLTAFMLLAPPAFAQSDAPSPPPLPDASPVALDPSTSALLILDLTTVICDPRPACIASLNGVARLLARARAAGALVVYSTTGSGDVEPQVAPRDGDPMVATRADKFYNTNLDQILKDHGAQTLAIVGAAANGAVLYTTFGAVERGYTVAIPVDGISSGPDFDTYLAEYQALNMPGFSNPMNNPLMPTAATLTRTDLVSFGAASK